MKIVKAGKSDLPAILELQKTAYLSEAKIHNNYKIQPLAQTLEDLEKEFEQGIVLKMFSADCGIIGSIRGCVKNNTCYIGKIMVHPDFQNRGFGKRLLKEIENYFPGLRYELFTSAKSDKNLSFYTKSGYVEFKRDRMFGGIDFVYLEKNAL